MADEPPKQRGGWQQCWRGSEFALRMADTAMAHVLNGLDSVLECLHSMGETPTADSQRCPSMMRSAMRRAMAMVCGFDETCRVT